jgi:hypothetical protein
VNGLVSVATTMLPTTSAWVLTTVPSWEQPTSSVAFAKVVPAPRSPRMSSRKSSRSATRPRSNAVAGRANTAMA